MTGEGRPLRFLVVTVGGWAVLRAWALWPVPGLLPAAIGVAPARAEVRMSPASARVPAPARVAALTRSALRAVVPTRPARLSITSQADRAAGVRSPVVATDPPAVTTTPLLPGTASLPSHDTRSRWSGSAWALLRGGTGAGSAVPVSQLGGAQAGFRLSYAFDPTRRLALTARVSAPLHGPGREAALGVSWRPTRAPVTLIAEQRVSLDGGRGGPAVFAIAGLNPTPVAAGLRAEAYGEAGAVKREQVEPFADGAARLTRPVGKGPLQLDLGVGAWGGAQPGATRVDIGPTLGASLPVARHHLRLTLDWRERVAGHARPASGPALTLGTDF